MGHVNLSVAAKPAASVHRTAAADSTHYQHGASTGSTGVPMDPELVAVVYAEPRDEATKAAVAAVVPNSTTPRSEATIVQKGMRFIPSVLPIFVGTAVNFPNEDDMYHNVFSYSSTHPFDLGRYRKDEKAAQVIFDQKGIVKVYCEIHEFMRATILVLDTPYFTVTNTEGKFQLDNLVPGNYTLNAWVNDKSVWSRPLDVRAGESAMLDLAPETSTKPAP
jgi:plastocyanin